MPTDEEEQLERMLTERRVRSGETNISSFQNFDPAAPPGTSLRTRLEYLAPTARNVFMFSTDDDDGGVGASARARVRMAAQNGDLPLPPRRRPMNVIPTAEEIEEDAGESGMKMFGTDVPYYLDPLPAPIPQMVGGAASLKRPRSAFVSRNSEMAAR